MEPLKTLFSRIFNLAIFLCFSLIMIAACGLTEPVVEVHTDKPVGAPVQDSADKTPKTPIDEGDDPEPDEPGDGGSDEGGDEAAAVLAFTDNIAPILADSCAGGACHGGTKIGGKKINNDESDRDAFLSFIGSDCDIDKLVDKLSKPGHGGGEQPDMVEALPDWTKDEPTCQN